MRYWIRIGFLFALTLHAFACGAQGYVPFTSAWKPFEGAADFSYLNTPLQPEDRMAVSGAKFVRVGKDLKGGTADDTPVRLFGMNLSHHAAFPDDAQAKLTAKTLRSLGFNAVRLHHLDTLPSGNPQEYRATLTNGPYPTLHAGSVQRLRNFLNALKQEGIYANLNITVGYTFRPKEDGVPYITGSAAPAFNSPAVVFYPRMVELQQQYVTQLLKALAIGSDSVLAQVEIINENSLSAAWFNWSPSFWQSQIAGPYEEELRRQWKRWVVNRYGSLEQACKTWGSMCPTPVDALPVPAEFSNTSGIPEKSPSDLTQQILNKAKALIKRVRSEQTPAKRRHDFYTFMVETDRAYLAKMKTAIIEATRPDLPVSGGQANVLGPLNILSQDSMAWVDVHHYTDHPDYPDGTWSENNWRIKNSSVANGDFIDIGKLSDYRDLSRPFVVSEFNQPYPNTNGSEIIPLMAAYAAMQDWNGLYFFDYVDYKPDRNSPNYFNFQGDWQKAVMTGHAAKIFRSGSLPVTSQTRLLPITKNSPFDAAEKSRHFNVWNQFLQQQISDRSESDFMKYKWGYDFTGGNVATPSHGSPVESTGTNGMGKASPNAIFVSGSSVAGYFGQLPIGMAANIGPVALADEGSPASGNTSVVLQALDGMPLNRSKHLLLSVAGPVFGSVKGSVPIRMQQLSHYKGQADWWTLESSKPDVSSGPRETIAPVWMARRPIRVSLTNNTMTALKVFPLTPLGARTTALPDQYLSKTTEGWEIRINATAKETALWFELTSTP